MSLGTLLYRLVKRFIPLDSTHVFLLTPSTAVDTTKAGSVSDAGTSDVSCRLLVKEDLRALSSESVFSVSPQFLADVETHDIQVVGVLSDNDIAGLCCFAKNDVPAHLNSGGSQFKGIGMSLPPSAVYLFKVFVKNEHRGKRLNGQMLNFALESKDIAYNRAIVTTTDITNTSFRNSIERLGFKRIGHATEAVMFGKHWFKVPTPIAFNAAQTKNTIGQSIVLTKPTV